MKTLGGAVLRLLCFSSVLVLLNAGLAVGKAVPPPDNKYETTTETVQGKINVHLVPHSHDDVGWQVTVDEYYFENVRYILDTVVDELDKDPKRRFVIVEMAFLARWMEDATEAQRSLMRKHVRNNQIEFINGGWCMHDEAGPLYLEMIDQTTRGHQFLLRHFGKHANPTVAWQIDPFGHSATQSWLLSAEAGMPSLFFGRLDYQDFDRRKNESRMEWVWRASQSMGKSADTFTGQLYGAGLGNYGTWIAFDGEGGKWDEAQVVDNPHRHGYNIDEWIEKVVKSAYTQKNSTRTNHQMWTLGQDFTYQDAVRWYTNVDKLIHHVNRDGRVHMLYSTPSNYVKSKQGASKAASLKWELRKEDLFPYADGPHRYWTGYFTSRPALKRSVREASGFLQAARQIEVAGRVSLEQLDLDSQVAQSAVVGSGWTDSLEGAVAVGMHHDAVAGTARQSVSDDYEQRLAEGRLVAEKGVAQSLSQLAHGGRDGIKLGPFNSPHGRVEMTAENEEEDSETQVVFCNNDPAGAQLNISMCAFTSGADVDSFDVVAWNPLGHFVYALLRVPVTGAEGWRATLGPYKLDVQLMPLDAITASLPGHYVNSFGLDAKALAEEKQKFTNTATHVMYVKVLIPAAGYHSVRVVRESTVAVATKPAEEQKHQPPEPNVADVDDAEVDVAAEAGRDEPSSSDYEMVENNMYRLRFDKRTGVLVDVLNKVALVQTTMNITWGYYVGSRGGCTREGVTPPAPECDIQTSGAYIFRPNVTTLFPPRDQDDDEGSESDRVIFKNEIVRGKLVTEIRQVAASWASHVIRLVEDQPYIEVEWTAGPIPLHAFKQEGKLNGNEDESGKELVIRYSSSIVSKGVFATDSNGLEMMTRRVNERDEGFGGLLVNEVVAGNYYPVNSLISIEDADSELVVATDRTQGGTSRGQGDIEMMVHRRTLVDDFRGVEEPLNETMCGCNDIHAVPGKMGEYGHLGDGGCWCDGLAVRGIHRLILDVPKRAKQDRRQLQDELNYPPTLAFVKHGNNNKNINNNNKKKGKGTSKDHWSPHGLDSRYAFSLLSQDFPPNVKLVTLTNNYADLHDGMFLLRIAHKYGKGEHDVLSKPATVVLDALFNRAGFQLKQVKEVSLTGNQPLREVDEKSFNWDVADDATDEATEDSGGGGDTAEGRTYGQQTVNGFEVTLRPMEVRTFLVRLD